MHLQAVLSNLFSWLQVKSVNAYTQELHTLFYCAYPQAQQVTWETE